MAIDLAQEIKSFSKEKSKSRLDKTQHLIDLSIADFESFLSETYSESLDSVVAKLKNYHDKKASIAILQKWISYLSKKNQRSTMQTKLSHIKTWLYEKGVELSKDDMKQLEIKKQDKQKYHALTVEELQRIIGVAKPLKKAMYLCLSSSAMRIGELLQLKKSDLDFTKTRIQVSIRAEITKKKRANTTFFSKECEKYLTPFLKIGDNDNIFPHHKDINCQNIHSTTMLG